MIEFECPECGEPLEISERMVGKRVRCVGCDERIEVPEHGQERAPRRRRAPRDAGLSGTEFLLYTLLFVFIPVANVFVSSILYYVWRGNQPRRANQINLLGFAVFGLHILFYVAIVFIGIRLRR